ncbi:MAG: peroxiredoxin, partial [Betaproteobacteria bacterium]|nr:peroxiredoxin [Betaproteobacteria bacterium]NBU12945.1 peroxiredoxin [Betaproteobacteria bacterium]
MIQPVHAELAVGKPAPDFELPDAEGTLHRLSSLRGRWVVVYFYPKNDTPGCTAEACNLR